MSAITTPFNGTAFKLWIFVSTAWQEVGYGTSNDVNLQRTMIDVSNKTDGEFAAFIAGRKSGTFSATCLFKNDSSVTSKISFKDVHGYWNNGTEIAVQISTGQGANDFVSATCLVSNISVSSEDDAAVTFTADFQMTGTITMGTSA
jgi:predicted secreted protein